MDKLISKVKNAKLKNNGTLEKYCDVRKIFVN